MVAFDSEVTARPGADVFDRPLRDGHFFLHHFPALRTGPLSLSPSGASPHRTIPALKLTRMGVWRTPGNDPGFAEETSPTLFSAPFPLSATTQFSCRHPCADP